LQGHKNEIHYTHGFVKQGDTSLRILPTRQLFYSPAAILATASDNSMRNTLPIVHGVSLCKFVALIAFDFDIRSSHNIITPDADSFPTFNPSKS